jgi:hypothetical protein
MELALLVGAIAKNMKGMVVLVVTLDAVMGTIDIGEKLPYKSIIYYLGDYLCHDKMQS